MLAWNDHARSEPEASDILPELPALAPRPGSGSRTPLALAVSNDQGLTWGKRYCVEADPAHGFCYVAMHFTEDALLLAYCAGGNETNGLLCRLRLRRITLDELPE